MNTLTDTEATVDEGLDFSPHCSVMVSYAGVKGKPCDNPATWAGFLPCCGRSGLVCDFHFKDRLTRPFYCGKCKKQHRDLLGWQKL